MPLATTTDARTNPAVENVHLRVPVSASSAYLCPLHGSEVNGSNMQYARSVIGGCLA